MSAPHYLFPTDETRVRPFRPRVSGEHIIHKRFHESYGVFFVLLGASPITCVYRMAKEKRYKEAAKGSAFAVLRTWSVHFTHMSLAWLLCAAKTPLALSAADEYDAADRRVFFHFARFFNLVSIPRWVAGLIGNEPVDDDELFFDANSNYFGQSLSSFAAAQDSFKRNVTFDVASIVVEAGSTLLAEKAGMDYEVYGIAPRSQLPRRLSAKVAKLVVGEIGAGIGRMAAPQSGDAEFWCELVFRLVVAPEVAKRLPFWPFGEEEPAKRKEPAEVPKNEDDDDKKKKQ